MRLTLKQQIILAPATVLTLTILLVIFLQYTYWDLSVKRQEARKVTLTFVALAEADLAAQRLQGMVLHINRRGQIDIVELETLAELHDHLSGAVARILELMILPESTRVLLKQIAEDLDSKRGYDGARFLNALGLLRPQLVSLAETSQQRREQLRDVNLQNIDELVARTAMVTIIGMGTAIPLGTLLSLFFARRLLRRIKTLSDSAGRIARGDLTAPPAPKEVQDELDELAVSISQMTERLIRVVSTEKLLEGAEEERRRIAMDLHDQSLSDLSNILRTLQGLRHDAQCAADIGKVEEDLQRAIANLRDVMENLHPQTLEILGFGAALQSHFERHLDKEQLPEYHLYVSPQVEGLGLSRLCLLSLYRITLEAVHNVIKHAQASRYEVTLDRRDDALVLVVEDNGSGFRPQDGVHGGGRGLNNIRERARAIGARVQWGPSRFTSGTRFELNLPLNGNLRPERDTDKAGHGDL
ncbi:sensor histidine kinase [Geoalkalibacter sp.]|uniref:sensor histidine kinase n=1 Tax=Geoalkalibacter sp. TaxID=3041440 RepID=UPI00272E1C99|nr:HAMP domain-containing protein [Geoalkalibacter sp.]